MPSAAVQTRKWDYEEYARLAELGFFHRQRVELIGGRIVETAPQRDVHAAAVSLARDAVAICFGDGFWVRMQLPLKLGRWSGPEPDISVVRGTPRQYVGTGHPDTALLLIEVSDTTLQYDRRRKAGLYAKYSIADYWIVNLVDRVVEVNRDPVRDPAHPFQFNFAARTVFKSGQSVQPLASQGTIRVDDLFPWLA